MSSQPKPLDRPLTSILVLGATGNIGRPIVRALAAHPTANYTVYAQTRDASTLPPGTFAPSVKVVTSDLTLPSLRPHFLAADAVICCLTVFHLTHQKSLIDLAIATGVARFVPSEFGIDTSHPDAAALLPIIAPKVAVHAYLERCAAEGKISYTTVHNGAFFDWFFRFPAGLGWDVQDARAAVYDGGETEYEVTTVSRIAEAVARALSPEFAAVTAGRRVYVNSFTVTQKGILTELEAVTGRGFEMRRDTIKGLKARVLARQEAEGVDDGGEAGIAASLLEACLVGEGGMCLYSRDPKVGGLWNERLGLKGESLREAVAEVVREGKKSGMPGVKS